MAWYDFLVGTNRIDESTKAFQKRGDDALTDKEWLLQSGEGVEDVALLQMTGHQGLMGYNSFFNTFINRAYETELARINNYRVMAEYPEIGDVIEDATNESCKVDENLNIISLNIIDEKLKSNENIRKVLLREFETLFFERIDINDNLWDMVRTYFIDGRLYYERIINPNKLSSGIINIKRLPSETMDYELNPINGRITTFYQYLAPSIRRPLNRMEAEKFIQANKNALVIFNPEQVGFINYGIYGKTRYEILGYLEKAKVPYNQLKLLETSVVIYRLVRSPERFVFKIDTGNMPRDKSIKYVEKIKQKFVKKQTFNPLTGALSQEPEIMNLQENFYVPVGCFQLSTGVTLVDGRKLLLSEIISEYESGKTNYVYTVDQKTGKIGHGEIEWAGITRKDSPMVRVTLDNGESVDCTPDHKFVMRDGSEVQAQNLKTGDSVMPLYLDKRKMNKNSNDYTVLFDLEDESWKYAHRVFGPKAKHGNVIHHKDFNRHNNNPDNLVSMPIHEHIQYHVSTNKERQSHLAPLKALNVPEVRQRQREAVSKSKKEYFANPENRKKQGDLMRQRWIDQYDHFHMLVSRPKNQKHKQATSATMLKKHQDPEYQKVFQEAMLKRDGRPPIKIDEKCCHYFVLEYIRGNSPNLSSLGVALNKNPGFVKHWKLLNGARGNDKYVLGNKYLLKIIKLGFGFNTYTEFKHNVTINHKVASVEFLAEKADVGCLTIKDPGENHNFALACGVFVKNSDGRGSTIETIGGNAKGFTELDDVYYFARKLFRALKYPISRVTQGAEKGEEVMFGGQANQISRDEIKWAMFLERQQRIFCDEFLRLFLLHLEFRGIKKEYNLDYNSMSIEMNPPSNYHESMEQSFMEMEFANYNAMKDSPEFSKSFLMRKYLNWDEKDFEDNKKGHELDKRYFPQAEEATGMNMFNGGQPGAQEPQEAPIEEEPTSEVV